MRTAIEIGTARAEPGALATGEIFVDTLATGERVSLPVIVVNGREDGQRLWINACIHGNEVNGAVAAITAARRLAPEAVRGAAIVTPIANPLAFQAKARLTPHDGGNLGESYPGNPDGTITSRIAHRHFAALRPNADCLIDLHSSGVTHRSRSYSVLKLSGHDETERKALDLLLSMGVPLNCRVNTAGPTAEPVPLKGSLDLECMGLGIPAFMVEAGNSGRVEPEVVERTVDGILNAMRHLGMLDGEVARFPGQIVTAERFMVRCAKSGLVVQLHEPHAHVRRGAVVANILDPFGNVIEEVTAPKDVYLISLKEDCVATAGDRIAFVGAV